MWAIQATDVSVILANYHPDFENRKVVDGATPPMAPLTSGTVILMIFSRSLYN
jgi:hypothetical protein